MWEPRAQMRTKRAPPPTPTRRQSPGPGARVTQELSTVCNRLLPALFPAPGLAHQLTMGEDPGGWLGDGVRQAHRCGSCSSLIYKAGSRCLLQDGERRHGRCCASRAGLSLLRRVGRTGAGYRTALPAPESPSFSLSAAMWTPRSCVVGARPSGDQDLGVVCFRGWGWGGAVNEEHRWD